MTTKKLLIVYLLLVPISFFFLRRLVFGAEDNLKAEIFGAFLTGALCCLALWGQRKKNNKKE